MPFQQAHHALRPATGRLPWPLATGIAKAGCQTMLLACLALPAVAQLTPAARAEVDKLLHAVGSCGCEFVRGGKAYPAEQARQHLGQKFDYLDARGQLKTAEDFITKAGTRSSMTGEPYMIRCSGTAPLASSAWLHAQLVTLRKGPAGGPDKR